MQWGIPGIPNDNCPLRENYDTVPIMPDRSRKKPRDINKLASSIVAEATNDSVASDNDKNPAAVALGRLGGLKGGRARADKLSAKRRKEIAQKAATTRWAARAEKDG